MAIDLVKQHARQTEERMKRSLLAELKSLQKDIGYAIKDIEDGSTPTGTTSWAYTVADIVRRISALDTIKEVQELADVEEKR